MLRCAVGTVMLKNVVTVFCSDSLCILYFLSYWVLWSLAGRIRNVSNKLAFKQNCSMKECMFQIVLI